MARLPKAKQARYEQVLRDLHRRIGNKLENMEETVLRGDEDAGRDESEEFGAEGYARDLQLGLIENEDEILQLIEAALKRIEEGRFGTCEGCDALIPERRLQVIPYARFCVSCQAKVEEGLLDEE